MGARKVIANGRPRNTNIQKNRITPGGVPDTYAFPGGVVRSNAEYGALKSALQVFLVLQEKGLKLPGRDAAADSEVTPLVRRVLARML